MSKARVSVELLDGNLIKIGAEGEDDDVLFLLASSCANMALRHNITMLEFVGLMYETYEKIKQSKERLHVEINQDLINAILAMKGRMDDDEDEES